MSSGVEAIKWESDHLELLDQRLLPGQEVFITCNTSSETASAITEMVVRGAPAIGVSAAYGVVLACRDAYDEYSVSWKTKIDAALNELANSRPTAVNLFWALDRMKRLIESLPDQQNPTVALLNEAKNIHNEDVDANKLMGKLGAELMAESADLPFSVITHCNTGSLATGGYGTALGVIRHGWKHRIINHVYADETRPWLQGARLTAWELQRDGIPVTLNADSAAAHIMKQGDVKWVVVGADRITANGDAANKIGTYSLAVLARYHGIKFMVVAPSSTVDMSLSSGDLIPIEERTAEEVTTIQGIQLSPEQVDAFNPVFDVTPAELIDAIVTEQGVVLKPTLEKMKALLG
ncbi:S-methyl-5-thioribose-1-phosphate isomerase [Alkalimarinus sediminis]|uniref:Methylthioribose-1-phosphate isomerase n=1 Tax=Alkalimarinus sediminis TaxID=1632866 RepID=A0A9E8HLK0_9ALTE|nr:S-methyl-5-thioribose-1-phosphate isomerase [Alkalimarinus sediminis]UZW76704.1 S-methyl-5-thioribose-1-phosphate isomerase [Alkalimarinus sediminis]